MKDLVGVALDQHRVHHLSGRNRRVQVLLQVHRQVLEDEVEPGKKVLDFKKAGVLGTHRVHYSQLLLLAQLSSLDLRQVGKAAVSSAQ